MFLGARIKFKVLECESLEHEFTGSKSGLHVDSIQCFGDLLIEILGGKHTIFQEFALQAERDRVAQDDRDGRLGGRMTNSRQRKVDSRN